MQTREQEAKAALEAQRQQFSELERAHREFENSSIAARTHAETEAGAAQARLEALGGEIRQQAEQLSELRRQMDQQAQDSQTALQEMNLSLSVARQRNEVLESARRELEADAAAARARAEAEGAQAGERIAALEAEIQQQTENARDLRVQLGAVRDSLAQRNALIERVEVEAASSVAMLGNIQQNLEHLGAEDQPHLLTRMDGSTGIVHLLGRRTTLGRTPDNDVHIDAEFISRHHAVALRAGGKTVIEDLNSTNGTYVNGQRISRRTLKDGDLVMLGKTEFRFSVKALPV